MRRYRVLLIGDVSKVPQEYIPVPDKDARAARDTKSRPDLAERVAETGELWEVFVVQEGSDKCWTAQQWLDEELPKLEELLGR